MSEVFPSPTRLRGIITTAENLLGLFDGKDQPPPSLRVVTIHESALGALPAEYRARLHNGNQFAWVTANTEAWVRRSECLRELEGHLNPGGHPFDSPQRRGRLVCVSAGWYDSTGCPQALRDLFDTHDELIRLQGLELMPETGWVRPPAFPILDHLGFEKTLVTVDAETGEEIADPEPNPLPPFDATAAPPPIPFWVRDQLGAAVRRLKSVEERGRAPGRGPAEVPNTMSASPDPWFGAHNLVAVDGLLTRLKDQALRVRAEGDRARREALRQGFDYAGVRVRFGNTLSNARQECAVAGLAFAEYSRTLDEAEDLFLRLASASDEPALPDVADEGCRDPVIGYRDLIGPLTRLRDHVRGVRGAAPLPPIPTPSPGPAEAPSVQVAAAQEPQIPPRAGGGKEAALGEEFAGLRAAAEELSLTGNEAKIIDRLCQGGGNAPLTDIASVCKWDVGAGKRGGAIIPQWNSARFRLNKKLRKHRWRLVTNGRNVYAKPYPKSARK
jgi:hypothetical protein